MLIERSDTIKQVGFPRLKYISVKIPNDQIQLRLIAGRFTADHMEEPLFALSILRLFRGREHVHKGGRDIRGVDHDPFGGAGVNASTSDADQRAGRVEGLVFIPAQVVAVQCIGDRRAEAGQIHCVCQAADFFIRRKGQADQPVGNLGMRAVIGGHCHDRRDRCLVIAPEERGAVRQDQILSDIPGQGRKLVSAHDDLLLRI